MSGARAPMREALCYVPGLFIIPVLIHQVWKKISCDPLRFHAAQGLCLTVFSLVELGFYAGIDALCHALLRVEYNAGSAYAYDVLSPAGLAIRNSAALVLAGILLIYMLFGLLNVFRNPPASLPLIGRLGMYLLRDPRSAKKGDDAA